MSSSNSPWRVTPTNAGPDSKGIVSVFGWELEGMIAFYLVGGALFGMLLIFALNGRSIGIRALAGVIPVLLSAIWVKIFVHGRPPAYQSDVFERWLRGSHFRLCPQLWTRKRQPRAVLLAVQWEKKAHHG